MVFISYFLNFFRLVKILFHKNVSLITKTCYREIVSKFTNLEKNIHGKYNYRFKVLENSLESLENRPGKNS